MSQTLGSWKDVLILFYVQYVHCTATYVLIGKGISQSIGSIRAFKSSTSASWHYLKCIDGRICWNRNRWLPFVICWPRKTNVRFTFPFAATNGSFPFPFAEKTEVGIFRSSVSEFHKRGDMETWRHRHGDMETWNRDIEPWSHGAMKPWSHGDMETWRHEDMETWWYGDVKRKTEAPGIFHNPFVYCSSCKWKFAFACLLTKKQKEVRRLQMD